MSEMPSDRELRRATTEYRWVSDAHARNVRFFLALNVALAAAALGLLKMEGPYFGDAIAAALFVCGFLTCLLGVRSIKDTDAELRSVLDRKAKLEIEIGHAEADFKPASSQTRGLTIVLVCFAIFHLASAVTTIWLTYVSPIEPPADVDSIAFYLVAGSFLKILSFIQ